MKINEIFYSVQGESTWIGKPMTFIRTAGCNLRCVYCDTKYAFEEGQEMTIEDILFQVNLNKDRFGCRHVCITGGEPLVQEDELLELLRVLDDNDYIVSLETNGTMNLGRVFGLTNKVVMDIKCPSSKIDFDKHKTIVYYNLDKYITPAHDEIKFVIHPGNSEDELFVLKWMEKIRENVEITFSPMIKHPISYQHALKLLSEWAMNQHFKHKVRVLPQLHKIIWPKIMRGV